MILVHWKFVPVLMASFIYKISTVSSVAALQVFHLASHKGREGTLDCKLHCYLKLVIFIKFWLVGSKPAMLKLYTKQLNMQRLVLFNIIGDVYSSLPYPLKHQQLTKWYLNKDNNIHKSKAQQCQIICVKCYALRYGISGLSEHQLTALGLLYFPSYA